ncbi:MAG TPA: class I SAM-dependent methyltransferase, partial [Cryomorphaceae bacterium]|nr:class I SAM-dependent methyltransferase [Cryomorphaceae bacterium]
MQTSNDGYTLLDFGCGRKLEQFDNVIVDRPEILALGNKTMPQNLWNKAVAVYLEKPKEVGVWNKKGDIKDSWICDFPLGEKTFKLQLSLGKFKHLGVFPEQLKHWNYLFENLSKGKKLLNLFGYTGAASLAGALAGAEVFHVDSSKSILKVARENAKLNKIANIHWVQEDALKFALREGRRQNRYDIIVMDPPIFGRGRKGE